MLKNALERAALPSSSTSQTIAFTSCHDFLEAAFDKGDRMEAAHLIEKLAASAKARDEQEYVARASSRFPG